MIEKMRLRFQRSCSIRGGFFLEQEAFVAQSFVVAATVSAKQPNDLCSPEPTRTRWAGSL